jgi:hypothetical protein
VVIDSTNTLTIKVPEKVFVIQEDEVMSQQAEAPTCGWLLEQVSKKYAQLIKEQKHNSMVKTKIRKKLIVALKTADKNETLDFLLTQHQRYSYLLTK